MAYIKSLRSDLFCPNITGTVGFAPGVLFNDGVGALFRTQSANAYSVQGTSNQTAHHVLNMNLRSSNATYTDSGKVYPLSLALNFIIKS